MTGIINKKLKCKNCEEKMNIRIVSLVNVTLNPELRKMILNETLFEFKCSSCSHVFKILYPCLYHDMSNKFMIYYVPDSLDKQMDIDFLQVPPEVKLVEKRIVNNISTLKEEILIFENGLSDIVVCATKIALMQVLKLRRNDKNIRGYFYGNEIKSSDLKFIFFSKNKVIYKKVRYELYKELYSANFKEGKSHIANHFIYVNNKWIEDIEKKFKNT